MSDGEAEIVIQGVTETDEPFAQRLGGDDVRAQRRWFLTDHERRPALRCGSLLENLDSPHFCCSLRGKNSNCVS